MARPPATRSVHFPHLGDFLVPAESAERSRGCESCARDVLQLPLGEYSYPRAEPEDVRTVLDVGSNLGAFAIWACLMWWPGRIRKIHCYEPNANASKIARINCELRALPVQFHRVAVTTDPRPYWREIENWGGCRTYGETSGTKVAGLHPRELPAAEALKVDAEGVDLEVFEHYPHWSGVRVAMWEWHEVEHRTPMEAICAAAGLTKVKHTGDEGQQGVQCWVRP